MTCRVGASVVRANGDVWVRVASQDLSGQFPAAAHVEAPSTLDLEVTNPLGGTEASIRIRDAQMTILENKKAGVRRWLGAWNGVPVQFAVDLFLGRIPCPTGQSRTLARAHLEDGTLVVRVEAKGETLLEEYRYQFKRVDGIPWAKSLLWTRKFYVHQVVEFVFEDAEAVTRSPLYWKASSKSGELVVNWKERRFDTGIGVR